MPAPIITLTTDFGTQDPYVAQLKGVLLTLNPQIRIVDVTHEIAAQCIRQAAYCVATIARYFPSGTVHLVVVDPGVGSNRRLLCVTMHGQSFVAPDNGVLTWAARDASSVDRIALTDSRFWRPHPSATFHGRDIMAPVAAHLSLGVSPHQLGSLTTEWVELPWPAVSYSKSVRSGEVLLVDHFGNLITNIRSADVPLHGRPAARVQCCGVEIRGIARTYADVACSELVALFGSNDLLEISIRNGNAAKQLQAGNRTPVTVIVPESARTP